MYISKISCHNKSNKTAPATFIPVKPQEQYPLRIDVIVDVRTQSMDCSNLSSRWNYKYAHAHATVPHSATQQDLNIHWGTACLLLQNIINEQNIMY
jgi:hypothetical protein